MTKPANPFRYFYSSPEVIRPVVIMYVKYPLSLRNVEDLLHERGIDISYETVRHWWNRFGPMFAAEIRKRRVDYMRGHRHWKWRLDEMRRASKKLARSPRATAVSGTLISRYWPWLIAWCTSKGGRRPGTSLAP
jgi:putative transposase